MCNQRGKRERNREEDCMCLYFYLRDCVCIVDACVCSLGTRSYSFQVGLKVRWVREAAASRIYKDRSEWSRSIYSRAPLPKRGWFSLLLFLKNSLMFPFPLGQAVFCPNPEIEGSDHCTLAGPNGVPIFTFVINLIISEISCLENIICLLWDPNW